jgi:CYTH domain-containing protein
MVQDFRCALLVVDLKNSHDCHTFRLAGRQSKRRLHQQHQYSVREKSDRPRLHLHHGPIEIERKFLVASDEWRLSAVRNVSIRDGLIAAYEGRKVRVRISGDIATIAIKGPRTGIVRPEFEYEIPIADAERMLSTVCGDQTLEKQRFFVEDAGVTWHVDVYGGILQGVVIAEIELKQEIHELILPPWVGREVTGDPFYKKINMRDRALKAQRREHLVRSDTVPAS